MLHAARQELEMHRSLGRAIQSADKAIARLGTDGDEFGPGQRETLRLLKVVRRELAAQLEEAR